MKTKQADVLYCGVRQDIINNACPGLNYVNLERLKHFIEERYRIHIVKDVEKIPGPPWTNDPVLGVYRFTNVRREHDRQTRYLIEHVAQNPELGLHDKVDNIFLLRAWNNWETMRLFGGPWSWKWIELGEIKDTVRPIYQSVMREDPEHKWWSAAYNQGGTKYAWKFPDGDGMARAKSEAAGRKYLDYEPDIPLRVFHLGPWLKQLNMYKRLMLAKDQQECFNIIQELRGFSTFLAYQIFVDLTYIDAFPFSENEFVVAGPGCRKGLDLLFENRDGMTYEECLFWLRDNIDSILKWEPKKIFKDLPMEDRHMNVMSLENCFCELSKYVRTLEGTGRPKVRYTPTKE
jgi:hypothetical protein